MENEAREHIAAPDQAPAPAAPSAEPAADAAPAPAAAAAQGYRKQPKKEAKPAAPVEKPKKPYTPPKPSITVQKWPALLDAIEKDDIAALQQLITEGVNINTVRDGFSPLMTAAISGKVEVARTFLKAGANVNEKDDDGNTALHRAASYQSGTAIVELLLQSGSDLGAKNRFNKTALALAEEQGHRDIVRSLQAHLDRKRKDEEEWQAFLNTPEGAPYKQKRQLDLLSRYEQFIWAPPAGLAFAGLVVGALFGAALALFFLGLVGGGLASWFGLRKQRQLQAYFDALEPLPYLDIYIVREKRKSREPLPPLIRKKPAAAPAARTPAAPAAPAAAAPVPVPAPEQPVPAAPVAAGESLSAEPVDAVILSESEPEPAAGAPVLPPPQEEAPAAPIVVPAPSEPERAAPVVAPGPAKAAPAAPAAASAVRAAAPLPSPAPTARPRAMSASVPSSFSFPDKRVLFIAGASLLAFLLLGTAVLFRHQLMQRYYSHKVRTLGAEVSGAALLEAASKNGSDVLALLLRAGIPADTVNEQGRTALIIAAEQGHRDTLELLLKADAALLDRPDKAGNTALMTASLRGREQAVALLVEKGADVNFRAQQPGGLGSPLVAAVSAPDFQEPHLRTVRFLLDHGADTRIRSASGDTALSLAAERGREQVVALLLDRGADVNAKDLSGDFPLLHASCRGHTAVARLLLDKGADIRQAADSQTPFLCAVEEGRLDTMKLLLERGADVNTQTAGGVTVLTIASGMENLAAVTLLLEKGADPASGYLPAPFLELSGRPVTIRANNVKISAVLHQIAQTATRDGYAVTIDTVHERNVTLKIKDAWNKVLHKLAMENKLLLLIKDKEIVVLSREPQAAKTAPY